jgi:phage terminase Nu1 subunit (DNA packaging protein)
MSDAPAFPLPPGVDDASVNKGDLASAFGVSETTVDRWIRDGCPSEEKGTNGRAYAFRLSAVWAWREGSRAAEDAEKARRENAVGQLRLALANRGDDDADDVERLSPREQKILYESERLYMLTAQDRRSLIPAAEAVAMLDRVFALVRDAMEAQPDRAADALGLSGAQIEALVAVNDRTLAALQSAIAEAFDAGGRSYDARRAS